MQANKMVLCTAPFRLSSVIEAAMEIAGPGAAMKRLQVGSSLIWRSNVLHSCSLLNWHSHASIAASLRSAPGSRLPSALTSVVPNVACRWLTTSPRACLG